MVTRTQPPVQNFGPRHLGSSATRAVLASVLVAVAFAAAGSSSGVARAPRAGAAAKRSFDVTLTKMRGRRYCELFLIRRAGAGGAIVADVWNSYPFGTCPQARWAALDLTKIAARAGAVLAVRNGPRFWLINGLEKFAATAPIRRKFGSITMGLDATLMISDLGTARKPYQQHQVSRDTIFRYASRSRVYELTAADGTRYVMQSWSQQVDHHLREAGLARLARRLHLPHGWQYRVRTLARALQINTTTKSAIVIQDDLGNSYSLERAGHSHR